MRRFDGPQSHDERYDVVQLSQNQYQHTRPAGNCSLLTIWKASAMSASEPTAIPTPSSRMKNAASMASMTVIRVDFDHAMLKSS